MGSSLRLAVRQSAVLLLCLMLGGLFSPRPLLALTVHTLGDFQDVTVMEVSGSYDVLADGQVDNSPRQAIAREYIATHGDVADFLVVFTNFDFLVPASTRAFYTPVRNQVAGIGLPLFDHSPAFSPDGTPLETLQGMVDMTNLTSHVLEPTRPEFETTLQALTHELMHRWGAYVSYLADDGSSAADLTDSSGVHWSFLLDSQGSALYGNHWRDNGDGTFTSIRPEQGRTGNARGRIFSPLELYLMGLLNAAEVPDLLLLECPGIEADRLPEVGVTIPAATKSISIDQIIAAEGVRVPAATATPKAFKMAFVLAVLPGTWAPDNADSMADIARLARFRAAGMERFSILTGGRGLLQLSRPDDQTIAQNPGLDLSPEPTAAIPAVENGIAWLLANQAVDGSWPARQGLVQRDTAAALQALALFPGTEAAVVAGRGWLQGTATSSTDFTARRLLMLDDPATAGLATAQNEDGGWGGASGYHSSPLDTALALAALTGKGLLSADAVGRAVAFLTDTQNSDGGWSEGLAGSGLVATAEVLLALADQRQLLSDSAILERGRGWLVARQNSDGGFGAAGSSVHATALALLALKEFSADPSVTAAAAQFLLDNQGQSGSWRMSVFETALAVQALHAVRWTADLAVYQQRFSAIRRKLPMCPPRSGSPPWFAISARNRCPGCRSASTGRPIPARKGSTACSWIWPERRL